MSNTLHQLGSATLAAANGETHTYRATYNPTTGGIAAWRDGAFVLTVTDATPLTSGSYVALRTYNGKVSYDNLRLTGVNATFTTLTYLYGDHLGSAAVLADTSGQLVDRVRFYPFGGYRGSDSSLQTDRGFTGHRQQDEVGLIYMNARWFVSGIGRFASADTVIPSPSDPQSYNRYSYTRNNPLLFIDPSGHKEEYGCDPNCEAEAGWKERLRQMRLANPTRDDFSLPLDPDVNAPTITSVIGDERATGLHPAIDIGVVNGTSVMAFADGVVVDTGQADGFGDYVVLRHELDGLIFFSIYAHLQQINVQEGDILLAGDELGLSNNTGASTGPHLHFEVRRKGGFDEETDTFQGDFFPDDLQTLDNLYVSPTQFDSRFSTAYGESVETIGYRAFQILKEQRIANIPR